MARTKDIQLLHFMDYVLIGVVIICLMALSILQARPAYAQTACMGTTAEQCGFPQAQIQQDPVIVLQRLEARNRVYRAVEQQQRESWRSYGYDVAIPIYEAGRSLPAAAAIRGEYDLELQRRSLCAGFASDRDNGPEGVYAGRALDCRRGVFD